MPLTVETATQAGQIAAQIAALQQIVTDLTTAVGANAAIFNLSAQVVGSGQTLNANMPFSATDSATLLNELITICNNNIATLTAQLGDLG